MQFLFEKAIKYNWKYPHEMWSHLHTWLRASREQGVVRKCVRIVSLETQSYCGAASYTEDTPQP